MVVVNRSFPLVKAHWLVVFCQLFIIALIPAIITMFQSKKIKELSDIVSELQNQSKELSIIAIGQKITNQDIK